MLQLCDPVRGRMEIARHSFFYQYLNPNGFGFAKDKNFHYISQRLEGIKTNEKNRFITGRAKAGALGFTRDSKVRKILAKYIIYIIYILYLCKNIIMMDALVVEKKRKNIDIPIDTFRNLSIRAVSEGRSLKSFIENLLVMEANSFSDEELYHYLVKNKPQGDVYLNEKEQKEFENWLGI